MRLASLVVAAVAGLTLGWPAQARAGSKVGVVGFSADGRVALVRYEAGPDDEPGTSWISIVFFDLLKSKVVRQSDVLRFADHEAWSKEHPGGDEAQRAKAMAGLRAQRWKALEKELGQGGFKVLPDYKPVPKKGAGTGAAFQLPSGVSLRLSCKSKDGGDGEVCSLDASRGKATASLDARAFDQVPSAVAQNWFESAFLDPARNHVLLVERHAGASGQDRLASERGSGLRAYQLLDVMDLVK